MQPCAMPPGAPDEARSMPTLARASSSSALLAGGQGRSGGLRAIVRFRPGERSFFVYGFAKSGRDNLRRDELKAFRLPGAPGDTASAGPHLNQATGVRHVGTRSQAPPMPVSIRAYGRLPAADCEDGARQTPGSSAAAALPPELSTAQFDIRAVLEHIVSGAGTPRSGLLQEAAQSPRIGRRRKASRWKTLWRPFAARFAPLASGMS